MKKSNVKIYMMNALKLEDAFIGSHLYKGRDAVVEAYVRLCNKVRPNTRVSDTLMVELDYLPTGRADDTWYVCFLLMAGVGPDKKNLGEIKSLYTSDDALTIEVEGVSLTFRMPGLKEVRDEWTSKRP